jgi:predicted DNA-binding transcriptional regulator AlpA
VITSDTQFLTPAELVARWGGVISIRTLANWRSKGKGPRFVRLGGRTSPLAYRLADIEAWEAAQTSAEGR